MDDKEIKQSIYKAVKEVLDELLPIHLSNHIDKSPTGSRADVMKYLNVSSSTLQRLTQTGEIKSFKIGGSVRYKWADIDSYLNNK